MLQEKHDRVFREFPVQLKLAGYLRRSGISYSRLAICAMAIRVPVSSQHRSELVALVRAEPFRAALSPHGISRLKCSRHQSSQDIAKHVLLLHQSLALLNADYEMFLAGQVRYTRLSFLMWLVSMSDDRDLLEAVGFGLQQDYLCQINEYWLSHAIQGNRKLTHNARVLIAESVSVLEGRQVGLDELF